MNDKISDTLDSVSIDLIEDNDILWRGNSFVEWNIRILEEEPYHDVMTGVASKFVIYLFAVVVVSIKLFKIESYLGVSMFIALAIVIAFLYSYVRYVSNRRTSYVLTTTNLYICRDFILFKKVNTLPLDSIRSVSKIAYKNGTSTLLLPNNFSEKIKTYNPISGMKRHHVSIEMIKEGDMVKSLIDELTAKNNIPIKIYEDALVSKKNARIISITYELLLFSMLLYLVDHYALPRIHQNDEVVQINRKSTYGYDTGGEYLTLSGIKFSTKKYHSFRGDEKYIEISYSPLFKSTTSLKNNAMDYTDRLDNDLHGYGKYPFLACIIALLFGINTLGQKAVKQESLVQLMVCLIFFGILFWVMNNIL